MFLHHFSFPFFFLGVFISLFPYFLCVFTHFPTLSFFLTHLFVCLLPNHFFLPCIHLSFPSFSSFTLSLPGCIYNANEHMNSEMSALSRSTALALTCTSEPEAERHRHGRNHQEIVLHHNDCDRQNT